MKNFKVEKDLLLKSVEKVSAAVVDKLRLTIIGEKVVKDKGTLTCIEAYDGKMMQIQSHFYVDTDIKETIICNLSKEFVTVVKALSKLNGAFNFNLIGEKELTELTISVGESAVIKIPILDTCTLMEKPSSKPFGSIKVNTIEFIKKLSTGGFAHDIRTEGALSGVFLEVGEEGITIHSTDGRKGSKSFLKGAVEIKDKAIEDCHSYVSSSINNIKGILNLEMTCVYLLDKTIMIQNGADIAILNKINQKFPITEMKKIHDNRVVESTIEINKKTLLDALFIASVTDDCKTLPLVLKQKDNKIYIISSKGNAKIHVDAKVDNNFDMIAFNYSMIHDCIANMEEQLIIKYVRPEQPLWIESKEIDQCVTFLCPVVTKK